MNDRVLDFQKIHADFRPKVQRYLTRMVGEHEAEDLTQEVFIKIHRALQSFRGESQLSTWIYRIAANTALDKLREPAFKQSVRNETVEEICSAEIEGKDKDVRLKAVVPALDQQLCRKERYDCYCNYIENLPANYRTVVALSELEDLAAGEIAEILGLSLDVVKIRLHRGRSTLIHALKTHCKPEDWH